MRRFNRKTYKQPLWEYHAAVRSKLYEEIKAHKKLKKKVWIRGLLAVFFLITFQLTDNAVWILVGMGFAFAALRAFEEWQRRYA